MKGRALIKAALAVALLLAADGHARAGQAPGEASGPDTPISGRDRFYTSDQFSNTVSVIDPATNDLLGVIRLGDQTPANLSPLYRGQLLVHGMGFSPDGKTLAVVSIGSNSVTFIDTATNVVKHTTYVGRSPHEAFYTPDGREIWVSVRGEDYVAVLDAESFAETRRIQVPNGPGMTIFSPDGAYGYVCSSFTPETVVIDTKTREIVGRVRQDSPFCPNIAATPDGAQVWLTLKDTGRVMVFDARPPFAVRKVLDTGPITNHVNFVRRGGTQYAYVTVGGENVVKVFRTDGFALVATIPTGSLPHGLWPSGDGTRIYVGLENADRAAVIDTAENKVLATIPIGQGPQAVAYVPNAVPVGDGRQNLQPLGSASRVDTISLKAPDGSSASHVSLFDQGALQILQAAVTGLAPLKPFVLAIAADRSGTQPEPLASFSTNPAGAAIVDAVGPIRQITREGTEPARRFLVVVSGTPASLGRVVQVQDD